MSTQNLAGNNQTISEKLSYENQHLWFLHPASKFHPLLGHNWVEADIVTPTYQFPDSVKYKINELFADSIMSSCIIICRILLAGNQLLRVEQLTVGSGAHLIWIGEKSIFIKDYKDLW